MRIILVIYVDIGELLYYIEILIFFFIYIISMYFLLVIRIEYRDVNLNKKYEVLLRKRYFSWGVRYMRNNCNVV